MKTQMPGRYIPPIYRNIICCCWNPDLAAPMMICPPRRCNNIMISSGTINNYRNGVPTGRKQYISFFVILARFKWKKNPILCDCRSLPATATVFKMFCSYWKLVQAFFILLRVPQSYKLLTKPRTWPVFQFWPGNNHPITQFLATQFDAGGQKIGPLFAFQRVFVIAGKFYLCRGPDPYLFWTVSHTINIVVWYEPRRSIFPFGRENMKSNLKLISLSGLL